MTHTEHLGESPLEPLAPTSRAAEALDVVQQTDEATDEQKRKVIANEAIYRELNDELESLAPRAEPLFICCECGDIGCSLPITIDRVTYDTVRSDPLLFVVSPTHRDPAVEAAVDSNSEFDVVRKYPAAANELAEISDRRLERDTDS